MSPRRLIYAATVLLLTTACAGKPMAVQDPVAKVAPMPMEKKGKLATFGSWTNTRTKGGVPTTITIKAGPWGSQAVKQNFDHTTTGGAASFSSTCHFDGSGQHVGVQKFGQNSAFACTITRDDGEVWTLYLTREGQGRQALLNGKMNGGGHELEITMTRTYADGSSPLNPVGYHFALAGSPVAAVQIENPPQVWMIEDLEPALRDAIAAGVGALIYSYPAVQQTFSMLSSL